MELRKSASSAKNIATVPHLSSPTPALVQAATHPQIHSFPGFMAEQVKMPEAAWQQAHVDSTCGPQEAVKVQAWEVVVGHSGLGFVHGALKP